MHRRSVFGTLLAAGAGLFVSRTDADAGIGVPKVVYHLSEIDRVAFVLGNIRNHIDGMGGPDRVGIALVVHGASLMAFRLVSGNEDLKSTVARLRKDKLDLYACGNTLRGMGLTLAQLLPGFAVAERGGVVKLAELQGQGWAYLRP